MTTSMMESQAEAYVKSTEPERSVYWYGMAAYSARSDDDPTNATRLDSLYRRAVLKYHA